MHNSIIEFLKPYKDLATKNILEVGSLNVNGSIRELFPSAYGVDMREGDGVDLVCKGEDLPKHFPFGTFEVIVSTETLEHVRDWREFLHGIWEVLQFKGHFLCTLASVHKRRHAYPDDYWRMHKEHVLEIFKDQEIVEISPDVGRISFGFVIKKLKPLGDLSSIHLLPVDEEVPKELLPISVA